MLKRVYQGQMRKAPALDGTLSNFRSDDDPMWGPWLSIYTVRLVNKSTNEDAEGVLENSKRLMRWLRLPNPSILFCQSVKTRGVGNDRIRDH